VRDEQLPDYFGVFLPFFALVLLIVWMVR